MRRFLLLISLTYLALSTYAQSLTIEVTRDYFQIDKVHQLILCHQVDLSAYDDITDSDNIDIILDGDAYTFVNIPSSLTHQDQYSISNNEIVYTLYFTQLPIVNIDASGEILNEPKRPAQFTYTNDTEVLKSFIGIELRGGSSISFPKNTFDLEFWESSRGNETRDVQFGNLREDDDWILDGVYNEPMRIRSFYSHKLWLDIHTPYYIDQEADAKSGVDVMYVEMFLNGEYNGLYILSEQIDRKLLQLKKYKDSPRGVLYKGESVGATTFSSLPNFNNSSRQWESYVMKYPKDDEWTGWDELYDFTALVMDRSDDTFEDVIWSKFNYDNYIDYFIYLNVLRLTDNTGKNIYLAKYDNEEPYFYVPWDLDGSIGLLWDGTYLPDTEGILTNGFHDRIIDSNPNRYNRVISNRWEALRTSTLSNHALLDRLNSTYKSLTDNNVYHREATVHGNYNFGQDAIDYMEEWFTDRLNFLDLYFADRTTSTVEQESAPLIIYPNPASLSIHILNNTKSNNYKILNDQGQIITSGSVNPHKPIDISTLSSGIYYLHVENAIGKFFKI